LPPAVNAACERTLVGALPGSPEAPNIVAFAGINVLWGCRRGTDPAIRFAQRRSKFL